ncbi:MAG: hypothetical protein GDA49_14160 [Rhodospirillales bacterium]|nr:hypothetical protein [Rhodospirillales bacterium]
MPRGDSIRDALNQGRKLLGGWVNMESPIATEIMAGAGFDLIMIDQEHGPGDAMTAIGQQQAIRAGGDSAAFLRVPANDINVVKKALDTGVDGLMVPMVETAEDAKAVADACLLPPLGLRGVAPGNVRAARYGYEKDHFVATRGRDIFVMTQVETAHTVDNLEAIGAIDGIDMLFIGRNDLSSSIGRLDDQTSAEAVDLLETAERKIKASGRWLGGIPADHDDAAAMLARGYDMVLAASDHALVRDGALACVNALKDR